VELKYQVVLDIDWITQLTTASRLDRSRLEIWPDPRADFVQAMSTVSHHGVQDSSSLMGRWDISPLCGSTNLGHTQEALAVEVMGDLKRDDPEVQALWNAMRKAGGK
jgi:hypothetical protein